MCREPGVLLTEAPKTREVRNVVLAAVRVLHEQCVCHGDLAPRNILVETSTEVS